MKQCTIILLLCFASVFVHSQDRTDSLLRILPEMPGDSSKVGVLLDLSWAFYRNDIDRSLMYSRQAELLAIQLELPYKMADARRIQSFGLSGKGKYAEADTLLQKVLEWYLRNKDETKIADAYNELGLLKRRLNRPEEALEYFHKALSLARKLKEENTQARVHNYIGGLYKEQKQYDKAIESYQNALELVRRLDIRPGISACLTNLGAVYLEMEEFNKAIDLNRQALVLKEELGDRLGAGRVLNNLGIAYNGLQRYQDAETTFAEAMEIAEEVGEQYLLDVIKYGQSVTAYGLGDYREAIRLSGQLLQRGDSITDRDLKVKTLRRLFLAHGALGQYEQAHDYGLLWQEASEKLYDQNLLKITNELEAKYLNEEKTREIEFLNTDSQLKEIQLKQRINERNAIILIGFLLLVLAILLFNQYRIKQRTNRELREISALKSNFFANISHEFRTPLTLIKGPIEQLEQHPDETLGRDDLKMIRRNTNKLLGLVNQLLDLSKIDQGKLQLKPTEGDIFKCLETAATSFNSHAAQRGMDYRVRVPGDTLWASFDRDKVEKVVYNLLSNAFKFSEDNEIVSFEVDYLNNELNIVVSDSGQGISEDKLPYIFDRFYQIEGGTTRGYEGSGIGLSLSRDLIQLMDGTLTVASEVGKGSIFTAQFPIERIVMPETKTGRKTKKTSKTPQAREAYEYKPADQRDLPLLLLVEDNQDMRAYIRSQLTGDFRVEEALNGKDGIRTASQLVPDLIITDLMMPKMDGMEFCKIIKTQPETSHIPVIMLTARAGIENKLAGLETGADDYLTKPFETRELMTRIRNLILQRTRIREHFQDASALLPGQLRVNSLDRDFLERLQQLLENQHGDAAFGPKQMQAQLNMSKTQLHRKAKALTGESPGELLRNFRLKRASQLLSQNADTVTQIAYSVGFNNLSYFARTFKERFGVSPSAFSKKT